MRSSRQRMISLFVEAGASYSMNNSQLTHALAIESAWPAADVAQTACLPGLGLAGNSDLPTAGRNARESYAANSGTEQKDTAMTTLKSFVNDHPLLQSMSSRNREVLAEAATETEFKAGEIIFRQGEYADRFYLIQKGKVALESHLPGHGDLLVQTIG